MLRRVGLFGILSILVLVPPACAPAPEPVAEEEPPAPPPPPTLYEITQADPTVEEPRFTSHNITVLGFKLGDITNDSSESLGTLEETVTLPNEYLTDFRDGAIRVYTFRQTGVARQIEVTTALADEIASPRFRAWLEDGDVDQMREWMGPEDAVEETDMGTLEYVYADRGVRFVEYPASGVHAIRFSEYQE